MNDLENMSIEELLIKGKEFQAQAREFQAKANACWRERVRRDAMVMLATADKARERARTGVCNKGSLYSECPVHQMGSCRLGISV
jgi:hypothetical protein